MSLYSISLLIVKIKFCIMLYFICFSHELNLSVRQSGFTIYRRYKPEWNDDNMLKVRFKWHEIFLVHFDLNFSSWWPSTSLLISFYLDNSELTLNPFVICVSCMMLHLHVYKRTMILVLFEIFIHPCFDSLS